MDRERRGADHGVLAATRAEGQGSRRRVVADHDERRQRDRRAERRSNERGHRNDCNASAHTFPSICRCTVVVVSAIHCGT